MDDTAPLVTDLVENIAEQYPVHRAFLNQAISGGTPEEITRLSQYLEFCLAKDLTLEYLAECYLTILGDTLEEQLYFRDHGSYRHSTFDEVAESVYHDRDYMDRYMYGLAITNFLWPNHVAMARFLRESLPRDRGGRYLEIGPGHGFLLLSAIEVGGFDEVLAVDLSAASVEQTRTIVDHFHPDAPARVEQRDFLEAADLEPGSFDAIVMGEVLEHVEKPDVFLRRIAELAKDDALHLHHHVHQRAGRRPHLPLADDGRARGDDHRQRADDRRAAAAALRGQDPRGVPRAEPADQRRLRAGQGLSHRGVSACRPSARRRVPPRRCTKATVESKVTAYVGSTSSMASFSSSRASEASRSSTQKHRWSSPPPRFSRAAIGDSTPSSGATSSTSTPSGSRISAQVDAQQRVVGRTDHELGAGVLEAAYAAGHGAYDVADVVQPWPGALLLLGRHLSSRRRRSGSRCSRSTPRA